MPIATIIAILEALAALVPEIPGIVQDIEMVVGLVQTGTAPTPEQQAQIDALLDKAHEALQSA